MFEVGESSGGKGEEEWMGGSSVRTSKGPGVPIRASDVIEFRIVCLKVIFLRSEPSHKVPLQSNFWPDF